MRNGATPSPCTNCCASASGTRIAAPGSDPCTSWRPAAAAAAASSAASRRCKITKCTAEPAPRSEAWLGLWAVVPGRQKQPLSWKLRESRYTTAYFSAGGIQHEACPRTAHDGQRMSVSRAESKEQRARQLERPMQTEEEGWLRGSRPGGRGP